jgi:drug/metabolite transporter (DMT)-like permease
LIALGTIESSSKGSLIQLIGVPCDALRTQEPGPNTIATGSPFHTGSVVLHYRKDALPMANERLSLRQYSILGLVAVCAPLGDTCLSRGMSRLPPISIGHPATLIAAVFTPWVAVGIALLIGFFASYLTALSWADLTYVLPATAFGNVIVALLSRFWLQEPISLERWAGILLITVGVGFVARGPSLTQRPADVELPFSPSKEPAVQLEEEQVR